MARSRINIARNQIVAYFDSLRKRVFNLRELGAIYREHHAEWRLAGGMLLEDFISYLCKQSELRRIQIRWHQASSSDQGGSPIQKVRYIWREAIPYEIGLSIYKGSYLSHYSAMGMHELTEQTPKTIYVNFEQKKHSTISNSLEQSRIDAAFSKPVRETHSFAKFDNHELAFINGKYTARLGVIPIVDHLTKSEIWVTDLERTLVDITVRPNYSGGVFEVLKAYKKAAQSVSINRLSAILMQLDYIYPYHQAIGFYLESAGYPEDLIRLIEKIPMRYDFYLMHQMENPKYSAKWRLFYPQQFA